MQQTNINFLCFPVLHFFDLQTVYYMHAVYILPQPFFFKLQLIFVLSAYSLLSTKTTVSGVMCCSIMPYRFVCIIDEPA